ncbi:hypothetical protein [Chryseobacterium profundimaris]|uniref:Uncharacterized protein n=1 Tax=Chryseobacterium profundimaris TaxID=1387275 RepID=A0ABY1NRI3_9FLAO|nr:hypothetical protein [Chryseobacterium profundimaris]SMP16418.1 hypothetical protein SAMN06264346_10436 [Chryseobacterium profundimaris]
MKTKVQKKLQDQNSKDLDFSLGLTHIVSLDPKSDKFWFKLSIFNISMCSWPYFFNKVISKDEFNTFKNVAEYAWKASKEGLVSSYQKKSISNISEILYEAKLMREVGTISNSEFLEIFLQVHSKLMQKYTSIKKTYLNKELKEKGISVNSARSLMAKLATLNEN